MALVNIGFIGAGGIAGDHLEQLRQIPEVRVVAICDKEINRAKMVAIKYNARAYSAHEEMLGKEKLDAVYICIPPFAHTDQEILAAKKGVHVFIEKPLATTWQKAREISGAIKEAGIITSVGYNWRYLNNVEQAREFLKGKKIAMVLGYWLGGLPGVPWWRVKAQSGGQMVEQTTHIVDLARYFAGEVEKIFTTYSLCCLKEVEHLDIEDVGTVILNFKSGAIGTISNTCILSQRHTVGINLFSQDLVLECSFNSLKIIRPGINEEICASGNSYLLEDQIFIEAVRTGNASRIRSPYPDALKTHAITMASNLSAQEGRPVYIKEIAV